MFTALLRLDYKKILLQCNNMIICNSNFNITVRPKVRTKKILTISQTPRNKTI